MQLITLLLASSLIVMVGAVISPALAEMARAFPSAPDLAVRAVLTIPALFIALAAPLFGRLLDRWGRRPVLLISLGVFGLAGGAGFLLPDIAHIVISRAVLGVAAAGAMTACTTLMADHFDGETRNKAIGLQAGAMGFAGIVYLLASGFMAGRDWRWPFLIYFAAWILLPAAAVVVTEPSRPVPIDAGATAPPAWLPPRALLICGAGFLGMLNFYVLPLQLPFHLDAGLHRGNEVVGAALAWSTLFSASAATQFARLRRRVSSRRIMALTFAGLSVGYVIVAGADTLMSLFAGLAVAGVGLGFLWPNATIWVVSLVPADRRARAIGTLTTAMFLGQFSSAFAVTPVQSTWGPTSPFLAAAAVSAVVAAAFASLDVKRYCFRDTTRP